MASAPTGREAKLVVLPERVKPQARLPSLVPLELFVLALGTTSVPPTRGPGSATKRPAVPVAAGTPLPGQDAGQVSGPVPTI